MKTKLLSLWTGSEVLVPALSLLYDLGRDSLSPGPVYPTDKIQQLGWKALTFPSTCGTVWFH